MIPPQIVLAAIDFSEASRPALEFASRLALQCGSALHVLYVEDPLLAAAAREQGRTLADEALEELHRSVTETRPAASSGPKLHVVTGSAPARILEVGRREHADLIVIGSHGMSGMERLVFGSTAEYVLRQADVSVIVVPPRWTAPRPDSTDLSGLGPVVAGIDFSESSVLATGAAAWFANALHTFVELVHVVPALPVLRRWQPHADSSMRVRIEDARRELASIAQGLGSRVAVQTRVEVGHVAETLAAAVDTRDERRRMLLLGRRAGGSRGTPPGAIAYRVLMRAAVPVFIYLPQP